MNYEIDRDALARRVLDVISAPDVNPLYAARSLISNLDGLGGYLSDTACTKEFEAPPLAAHVYGLGNLIQTTAKIAEILIEEAQRGIVRTQAKETAL